MSNSSFCNDRAHLDTILCNMFSNHTYAADYLFYAHMIGQCSIKICDDLPAAAGISFVHDHYNLYINPTLFNKFTVPEGLAVLKHEMLHILYGHVQRTENRTAKHWNYSTDCALNQHIQKKHLPDGCIFPDILEKLLNVTVKDNESAEYYYELIKSAIDSATDGKHCSQPEPTDTPGTHTTWEESVGDADLQKNITEKMICRAQSETIKNAGDVPNECSEWLELHSNKPQVNWKKVLRNIVGNKKVAKRSTINRRDRRFPHREDLRGKTKNRIYTLLAIVDVSGSMSSKAIQQTLNEVRNICNCTNTDIDIIQVDTYAHPPEKLTKTTKCLTRKGNGGTVLSEALNTAQKYHIDYQAIVVLTDGYLFNDDIAQFRNIKKRVIWLIESDGTVPNGLSENRMQAFKLSI